MDRLTPVLRIVLYAGLATAGIACNNYGLLDRLENPGGSSNAYFGTFGFANATNATMLQYGDNDCSIAQRIYCIEQ